MEESDTCELLLTGHEDGTVRFWDCTGVAFASLYKFSSAPLFTSDLPVSPNEEEDEWPPFKKVKCFTNVVLNRVKNFKEISIRFFFFCMV